MIKSLMERVLENVDKEYDEPEISKLISAYRKKFGEIDFNKTVDDDEEEMAENLRICLNTGVRYNDLLGYEDSYDENESVD